MTNALTYDDIQLVPAYSNVASRSDIELNTLLSRRYELLIPIVASPMDTVCGYEMAYELAAMGGVGCIHRFMEPTEQCEIVRKLEKSIEKNRLRELWSLSKSEWPVKIKDIPIMAAVGVQYMDFGRAKKLVESGANVILLDVAHGHHQNVIDMIKRCKDGLPDHVDIIAGNVVTATAVMDLEVAGADGIRCGIGGGSLCSTRIKTGFGVPNVSALNNVTSVANTPVIADGGIRTSGDIAKALAMGASCVMLGSLLAGTAESPGHEIDTPLGLHKEYRGSASLAAKLSHGYAAKNVEGESTTIPYKGSVKHVVNDLMDGLRSALSYAGSHRLKEFTPEYVVVTHSGITEAKPHLL